MTYLFLTPVLAAGTVTDLRFRKVPNGVIGFGAAAQETAVQLELFSLVMPGLESGSGCPCAAVMY